ncbi:MAG: apolipoprotein N-acyltransferase, partial [Xanthomonadaceae bacterium]|nr:apolipoprotein N-acyltransferase [Xanthomonadaceae bacterium]
MIPSSDLFESHPSESTPRTSTRSLATIAWPLLGIVSSALLLGLYARGGIAWPLGFIALVPWLLALGTVRTLKGALVGALLMTVAFALAVFAWFGAAFGAYVGLGKLPSMLILVALAPLLQPQVLAFALARHWVGRRQGMMLGALAGAAAWVGSEWLLPKLLGDTLGHGMLPSATLRQLADLGGAAGLSVLLLLVNDVLAAAIGRWRQGARALLRPLAIAATLIALMAGYGTWRLSTLQPLLAEPADSIRIGLIQSNITDYERLRREQGAYAVIRQVLDTHYTMSDYAVREQGAEALLWSETVYPTTFGSPKSEDGAALDREILGFVDTIGVPLVFGTYDLDAAGEYNTAAFVAPGKGLLGHYRKTHPFPLTEIVPAWLDGPLLRRALPWTGNWRAGDGARVFPLRTADGREVNVLPLICLDDVRSALAIDGARLGAQAILGLSNDSWFTHHPQGAQLHLAVASFRSIETRLPQLRATTNGMSAIVDESGEVVTHTEMGQQAVLVGEIPVRERPTTTLMLRWGDWVGKAGLALLLWLALREVWRALDRRNVGAAARSSQVFAADVVLLTPPWRMAAALLRAAAGAGLAWMLLDMLLREGLQVNSLAQIARFGYAVVAPAVAAWAIQRAFAARARIEAGMLLLEQSAQRIEIPLHEIAQLRVWRLALPRSGVDLQLGSGRRWTHGIALADPQALHQALAAAGSPARWAGHRDDRRAEHAANRAASTQRRLDHPLIKFMLFPLLPALPAFRLHQHIAFGGTFGEWYTYGPQAWFAG